MGRRRWTRWARAAALATAAAAVAACARDGGGADAARQSLVRSCAAFLVAAAAEAEAREETDAREAPLECETVSGAAAAQVFAAIDRLYAEPGADAAATPSAATLARNFRRTALSRETDFRRAATASNVEPGLLTRFEGPALYRIGQGSLVSFRTRGLVAAMFARLSALTGVAIAEADADEAAAIEVFFVPWTERQAFADAAARGAGQRVEALDRWVGALSTPCFVAPYGAEPNGPIEGGVVVIAAETGPNLATRCVNEELAQLMGLFGDHPNVDPSLFNDRPTYRELTRHDELLLRLLYDRRLAVGMDWKRAEPIVRRIARELTASG